MITFEQILSEVHDTETLELALFQLMNEVEAIPVPAVVFSFSLHWTLKRFFDSYFCNMQSVVNTYFHNLQCTYNLVTSRDSEDVRLMDGHTVIDVSHVGIVIGKRPVSSRVKDRPMINAKVFAACDKMLWNVNDDLQILQEWNSTLGHFHHHMINGVAHALIHYVQSKELIKTHHANACCNGTAIEEKKVNAYFRSPVEFGAFAYELARILYVHKIQPHSITTEWLRDYVNQGADGESLKTYFTMPYADLEHTFVILVKERLTQCYSYQKHSDENGPQLRRDTLLTPADNRHNRDIRKRRATKK